MSQRWRAVGSTVSNLIRRGVEPKTFHVANGVFNHYANPPTRFRYKDNEIFTGDEDEYRVIIRNRSTGTKLTIKNLLTSDAGSYRCEVSNGMLSVHSTANLDVGFSKYTVVCT